MITIAVLFVRVLCDCFEPRRRLEAEILVLRHQLNVLQQRAPRRLHLRWVDRALFIWLYRRYPRILDAVTIVRPETVVRWHRMGYAAYWRWKSRPRGGRPRIRKEVRDLIRRISIENPLWGAPRIHGELLKLGIDVAQSTVSIYMVPRQGRPLETWKTFLRNHMGEIASIDLFVVPTIAFRISRSWPSTAAAVGICGDREPNGGVVGTSNHRSISVGHDAQVYAIDRADRRRCCASDPWRPPSSVCSNLDFGSDRPFGPPHEPLRRSGRDCRRSSNRAVGCRSRASPTVRSGGG